MAERRALLVATPTGSSASDNGASLRVREVATLLARCGYTVDRTTPAALPGRSGRVDLAVAVSYACAGLVRRLRACGERTWLDAVDSWVVVNASGLRSGHPAYALRAVRDAARLLRMPAPDLVTWISRADLEADRGTVRGRRRLVLPGQLPGAEAAPRVDGLRRVVLAGDWGYPPNADGLRWFWQRVLPALEPGLVRIGATVAVFGTAVPDLQSTVLGHAGYAPDPRSLYGVGDVHVAPVRFGGGVKRKVLQPLLTGLPVVTTPAGARGLRPHALLDVRLEPAAFAAAVLARLASPPAVAPARPDDLLDADDTAAVEAWLRA